MGRAVFASRKWFFWSCALAWVVLAGASSCVSGHLPLQAESTLQPSVYSPSILRTLQHITGSQASAYHRDLAQAFLAAPNESAARRAPYICDVQHSRQPISVFPISFSIPDALFEQQVPAKKQNFSSVIPGMASTYRFRATSANTTDEILASEHNYHADMSRSLFAVTYKKSGWDCLRHGEIIAAGTLPVFTDIAGLPLGTMAAYPLQVLKLLTKWPGLSVQGLPGTPPGPGGQAEGWYFNGAVTCKLTGDIDRQLYMTAALALLQYGRTYLSTVGMARYLIQTVGIQLHDWVLLFGSGDNDDYQTDTLLHGLQSVMTTPIVDWPRTNGLYAGADTFTEEQLARSKVSRYGGGFTFAYRLHEPFGINRTGLADKLNHPQAHFDYVIFGVTHRQQWQQQGVCGKMPRERVIFVHGNDYAPTSAELVEMSACGAYIFAREMSKDGRVGSLLEAL